MLPHRYLQILLHKHCLNWNDAQQYCRQHYTDLITLRSLEDVDLVERPTDYGGLAWIGLFDDTASWKGIMGNDSNSWRWSVTGTTNPGGYQKWAVDQPNYFEGRELCIATKGSVVNGQKMFSLVDIPMSWEEAQSTCREHFTDLAMIEDERENAAVADLAPTFFKWIGLYREPWRWSDGRKSNFTNWASPGPNNVDLIQHCVREQASYQWNDMDCSLEHPFICEQGASSVSCFHTVIYKYHLINTALSWSDAQQYCRQHYTDLVTFWSLEQVHQVERPSGYGGLAWIGLFDDPASWQGIMGNDSNSWRWSATGNTSPGGYQKWAAGQPDYKAGNHLCVSMLRGLWYDSICTALCRVICFTGFAAPGQKNYSLVNIRMTWRNAQNYCRQHYTDLAMIEDEMRTLLCPPSIRALMSGPACTESPGGGPTGVRATSQTGPPLHLTALS
ncbi:hypothetical protein WMY93_027024 [Mugilogobius chulae]|uniref:C-type lectin domain-containing protein n=1 Tax=Mugilogobius chulae TaxID=88201 RepID=A0AAW0MV37_9GOBI